MRYTTTTVPLVYLATASLLLHAAGPVIGTVVSQGRMQVDQAFVDGNGNLTNGATVNSGSSPARIRLSNGNAATLGANSQARIFPDRLLLEKGQAVVTAAAYRTEALGFRALPAGGGAQAVVELRGAGVQVAAMHGPVKVTDSAGMVLARVNPGRALSFEPPSAAVAGTSAMTGIVRRSGSTFILKDEVTNLPVELRGNDLERHVGSRVQVTGKAAASADGESQVLLVSRLGRAGGAQQQPPDSQQGGNRPDTEKPKTGMSNGAKIALVVVAAGAAAGGIIAATGGKKDTVSR